MGKIEGKKVSTRYSSYNYILDTVPNPVVEVDENLVINLANREALNRWPSIIEGKSFYYTIIFGENEKPEGCFVEKTFKLKKNQSLEIKTKKGEIFLFKTNYIKEEASQRVVIHIQDISERKHMEEILRKSEERYRALVETSSDWIWEVDIKGIYTYVSPKVKDLLGYEQDEVIGKTPFDFMPPEEAERMSVIFKNIISSKKPFERLENINKHKDNRLVILETSGVPIFDANRNLLGYRGVDRDITERKQVEEALRIKDSAVASSINAFAIADLEGNLTYVNPSFVKMWGYDDDKEVLGRPAVEFWQMEEKAAEVVEALRAGKGWIGELVASRKDGSLLDVQLSGSMVVDKAGMPICMLGSFIDVTEHKRVEEALRESEERFRLAFENANIGMCLVNLDGRLTRVNSQMCKIFGYNQEELESMTVNDLAHPEDLDISPKFIQRAASGEIEHTQFEKRYFHKQGDIVWGQVSSSLVRDLQGAPLYFISHVQDITEQKRIEDALKKSEERYKTLVENQGEGIGLVNEQEEFLYANPAAEHIFGVPPGTLIGRNLKDFLTEENYNMTREQTKLRQKGIKSTYEVEIIQPGGKKRTILVTATPEFDDKKRFKNTFSIFYDISEQKRMQEEILKSKKFESLGFLAAGIAHDFNNLLTIILGNIELAKRSLVTENKAFKFILKSEEAVHEAVELVQRFLIFSEDKSVMMKTESIRKIIQNSTDRVLSDSNIICSYEIPDDLWSLECNVDQIYYTITNLILNAKEALSNEGKIEIKASNEVVKANQIGTLKSGKYIKLTIKDYGSGISKEYLSRIFDPYFSTKDKLTEKGLGLGLTTIYSVIMKHKGYINVASEKGVGTTVEIYLPALKIDKS